MDKDFAADKSLKDLRLALSKYKDEDYLNTYEEKTYILDILFFLGKSIDNEEFNGADGFSKFVSQKLFPLVNDMTKRRFRSKIGHKG